MEWKWPHEARKKLGRESRRGDASEREKEEVREGERERV